MRALALLLGSLAGSIGPAGATPAASPGPPSSVAPLGFADRLFAVGDYYRAIGEYERYLFAQPDGSLAPKARLRIGLSYLEGGRAAEAAAFFDALAADGAEARAPFGPTRPAERRLAALEAADARYRQGEDEEAILGFHRVLAAPDLPEPLRDRAEYLLGWSLLLDRQSAAAAAAFREVGPASPLAATARELVPETAKAEELPHRSPALAGLLSALLPGAGYFYLGEPGTGVAALGWNGLFGLGVADAAVHRLYGVTAVLAVFEAMWYGGAIFGSVSGAHKYNRDAWLNYRDELKARFDWKGDSAGPEAMTAGSAAARLEGAPPSPPGVESGP